MRSNLWIFCRAACAVCLLLPSSIIAQDYRPGYVIKSNADSISGFIEYATEKKNSKYCMFRASRKSKSVKFTPNDILRYGFYSDKQYQSMLVPSSEQKNKVFVKVLATGPLQLYQHKKEFLIKKDSLILLPTPKSKMVETSQGMRSKDDGRYKGLLNFVISDCKLSAEETRYTEYELTNLVNNYNRCKGIEPPYKKEKPIFKANYVAFAGYTQSNLEVTIDDPIPFNKSNTVVGGLGVDLSSPRIFDRAFFTFDLSYVKSFYQAYVQTQEGSELIHRDITMDFTSIKVPLGLRYNFLRETNTPYIKGGILLNFLAKSDIRVIEERQQTYGVVYTKEQYDNFDLQKKPKGIWVAVGYNRTLFNNIQLFGELRYDQGEGFIGTPIQSFSNMKNYSFLLGIRF